MHQKIAVGVLSVIIISLGISIWWVGRTTSRVKPKTTTAEVSSSREATPLPSEIAAADASGTPLPEVLGETSPTTMATTYTMPITNKGFPATPLIVKVGDTVVWRNDDTTPHTVTASDTSFDSSTISAGKTFSQTFSEAGEYQYSCQIHPTMTGRIIVQQ